MSRVLAIFAVIAGCRNDELTTTKPSSTRGTIDARAVIAVTPSNATPSGSHFATTCSPIQIDSKPSRSPSWAISTMRSHAGRGSQPSKSLK